MDWVATMRSICLMALMLLTLGLRANASIFHVSPLGSSTPPFDTYARAATHPLPAIQAASGYGDTILIHSGTYDIDTTMEIPRGSVLCGVHRDSVLLVSVAHYSVVLAPGNNEIYGLSFAKPDGGSDPNVSAIVLFGPLFSQDTLRVWNCRFDWLRIQLFQYGVCEIFANEFVTRSAYSILPGGLGRLHVHHNYFFGGRDNAGGDGAGLFIHGGDDVIVEHNHFDWSLTRRDGFPIRIDDPTTGHVFIRNNIIRGGAAAIWWFYGNGVVENNVIIGPDDSFETSGGNKFYLRFEDTLVVRNNVFLDLTLDPVFSNACRDCGVTGPITYVHNAFWPPRTSFKRIPPSAFVHVRMIDSANGSTYPMFDTDSTCFLQFGSPLINAGDPLVLDADGTRSDIGWTGGPGGVTYDYQDLAPKAPESLVVTGVDSIISLSWKPRVERDVAGYLVYRGAESGFWNPQTIPYRVLGATDSLLNDTLGRSLDTTYFVVTAVDIAGNQSNSSSEAVYTISANPPNRPPVLADVSPQSVVAGDTLHVEIIASDPDGDSLSFVGIELPAQAELVYQDRESALLQFAPDSTQTGAYSLRIAANDAEFADTAVILVEVSVSETSELNAIVRVYPNPLRSHATIEIRLAETASSGPIPVQLVLHDLVGRTVAVLFSGELNHGTHSIPWDVDGSDGSRNLATGVYLLRLSAAGRTQPDLYKIAILN